MIISKFVDELRSFISKKKTVTSTKSLVELKPIRGWKEPERTTINEIIDEEYTQTNPEKLREKYTDDEIDRMGYFISLILAIESGTYHPEEFVDAMKKHFGKLIEYEILYMFNFIETMENKHEAKKVLQHTIVNAEKPYLYDYILNEEGKIVRRFGFDFAGFEKDEEGNKTPIFSDPYSKALQESSNKHWLVLQDEHYEILPCLIIRNFIKNKVSIEEGGEFNNILLAQTSYLLSNIFSKEEYAMINFPNHPKYVVERMIEGFCEFHNKPTNLGWVEYCFTNGHYVPAKRFKGKELRKWQMKHYPELYRLCLNCKYQKSCLGGVFYGKK